MKLPSAWQWLYPLTLAATVVFASNHGQVAAPPIIDFDKIAHFSVFGLMATLVFRQFRQPHVVWAVLLVSLFGISDELHQSFTPGRSMDVHDWIADSLGASVAVVSYRFWGGYRRLLEMPLRLGKRRIETTPAP